MIDHILWMLVFHENEGEGVKENIQLFIESKKFNIIKMMYERSKEYIILSHHQLKYFPELKL